MKTLLPAPFVAGTAVLVCCLALTACSTPKGNPLPAGQGLAEVHRFFLADRLYLLPAPHARLYVEVDAVEGCVPSGAALDKLRSFLGAYCNKPGGIEIARSDVIPLKDARGISPSALARRYLDGPPENPAASSPAFIYVLFYNDALCDQVPATASGPQAKGARPRPRARNRNPHVEIGPYPAMIYLNTRSPIGFKWEQKWNLLHEAGHVLGLAFRPVGASAGHCLNRACLMSGAGRYRYLGLQRRLCEQCVAQLAEAARQSPSTNQRFVGPVLVRSEAGYHVLSLPHREKVIVGELAENDCREFAAAVRAATPAPGGDENDWRSECRLKEEASHEPAALRDILKRAKAEPDELVRRVLSRLCAQVCAGWYCAHGQYGDAVSTFREAILLSPDDDWDYNGLAWIKATCPDSSVRDGKEAVGAATKACELAEWKEWNWIDTLAAAYAEAGDFKRAIGFEEQALRTGKPSEPEQKEMRDRILLFKQSQPFRERR
jgi:tetratricopeptide (TPR) repeat protein/predicted small secreted protein